MNWAGAEENEFPSFGSKEEIHETGVKLVHMRLDLWPGGERHFTNDLEVFWLRVEKQMKVQKKIEMRKNDLMSQIVIFFPSIVGCSSILLFLAFYRDCFAGLQETNHAGEYV